MQEHRVGLSVGDGFKFGCGFILASVVFQIILVAVFAIVAIVISLLGYALTLPDIG